MAEAVTAPAGDGTQRAQFRLRGPAARHHYLTLRESPAGLRLEVRSGLVWGYSELRLVVHSAAGDAASGPVPLTLEEGGRRTPLPARVRAGDEAGFARAALALAAERLGVALADLVPATHIDLGESGSLQVEAAVRERSAVLLAQLGADPAPPPLAAELPRSRPAAAVADGRASAAAPATPAPAAESDAPRPTLIAAVRREAAPAVAVALAEASRPAAPASPQLPIETPAEAPAAGSGWLGRLVGWLRRTTRAALGRGPQA